MPEAIRRHSTSSKPIILVCDANEIGEGSVINHIKRLSVHKTGSKSEWLIENNENTFLIARGGDMRGPSGEHVYSCGETDKQIETKFKYHNTASERSNAFGADGGKGAV